MTFIRHLFFTENSGDISKLKRFSIFLLLLFGLMLQSEGRGFSASKPVSASTCGYCGQEISGEYIRYKDGPVYHRACHDIAKQCKICGFPIGKSQKATSDIAGNTSHSACYQNASFCAACKEPITADQSYRKSNNGNTILHASCFENARFCGITGAYIRPGVETVQIGPEIFIRSEYDKSRKCLVSALPLANHGRHIVNRRSKTFVLEKYQRQTRKCYSCGDWLTGGYALEDQFLCKYCYQHSVTDKAAANEYFKKAIGFFKANGIRIPGSIDIVILPPGQRVVGQTSTDMKGACNTTVRFMGDQAFFKHEVEILYGLNVDRFATTLVHELSHAIIAEAIKYTHGKQHAIPYEEGRCEYLAFRFALENNLPDYIVAGFASNRVDEYREGFLYFHRQNPVDLKSILIKK
ncbi:MAG: hypothetical protein GY697_11170 [Desulfobacterales bacterium]|nr:hypothetical protein [Desulfobacterales bacterium]